MKTNVIKRRKSFDDSSQEIKIKPLKIRHKRSLSPSEFDLLPNL